MESRKYVLLVVALITVTGCAGLPATDSTQTTEQGPQTTTTTQKATTTEAAAIPSPCNQEYQPDNPELTANDTREFPEKPAELNANTAKEFAREAEVNVSYNQEYQQRYNSVLIVPRSNISVEPRDSGYLVTIHHVDLYTRTETSVGSNAWSAYYVITDSGVARAESTTAEPMPDEFALLHCWNTTE
jgi:hypothetical protein